MQRNTPARRWGFSLVEVCLALGVVSFSLVSLIALLPSGLNALRESKDQTIHAQIVQRISSDLAATDYDNLSEHELYFDHEGQYLGETLTGENGAHYRVELTEEPPSLPGLNDPEELAAFASHLKRIRVGIARADIPTAPTEWYAIQVAKN